MGITSRSNADRGGIKSQKDKVMLLPNKLARPRKINGKCLTHKYRRFSKKNKTYRTDRYYCANCGHQKLIVDIFGSECLCWGCDKIFNIKVGDTRLFPLCANCLNKKHGKDVEVIKTLDAQDISSDWIEGETKKEDIFEEMLGELGIK